VAEIESVVEPDSVTDDVGCCRRNMPVNAAMAVNVEAVMGFLVCEQNP
jgi:hypothetical protein